MKRIKIFALVEGKVIDKLSDRVSGTFIRIHYILKHLKQREDINLIYIPFEYKQKFSTSYSRMHWFIDLFYHFTIPFLSWLIIVFWRPDFVYFSYPVVQYYNSFNILLLRFAKRIGVKLLMYSHDWVELKQLLGTPEREILLSEKWERELVKKADILVVVQSKYPEYETAVLPGGFEEKEFANLRYGMHRDRFNIAYVGRLVPDYGIKFLVDSAIMLHEKHSYMRLLLFGEMVSLDEETMKQIKEADFIIHQIIPRTELVSHYSDIDVFAYSLDPSIPYHNNNRPTKLFEYIGSEIPFIATRCDGLKRVSDGKGFLWVDYSAEDFCEKLEYLLKHPQERMRLSRELHELKKDNTWKNRSDKLYDMMVAHLNREKGNSDC